MATQLKGGMFLYFDKQGNLKEQINDTPLRQGNSGVNKIYVYWENGDSENIIGLWSRYTRAEINSLVNEPSATTYFDEYQVINDGVIPYSPTRDMKFFKDYQEYKFYEIVIPDSVLSVGDATWLCSLWFVLDQDNDDTNNGITTDTNGNVTGYDADEVDIFGMGGITFYVIPLGLSIAPDENINVSQWNYLMKTLSYYKDKIDSISSLENSFTILSGRVSDIEENYVTTNTNQTITGKKTFNAGASFGSPLEMNGNAIEFKTDTPYKNKLVGNGNGVKDYTITLPNKDGTIATNEDLLTYAKTFEMSIDENYDLMITLKDGLGNTLAQHDVDLPLESLITDGYYDSQTESIVLDLASGGTIVIPVSDLLSDIITSSDLADALDDYYDKTETYSKTEIDTILDGYVEKEQGKGLSTNDFTTQYKNDLIQAYNYSHWHNNKDILDGITQNDINKWDTEYLPIDTFKEIKSGKLEVWDNVGTSLLVEDLTLSGEDFSTITNISFRRRPTTGNPQSTFGINTRESGIATRDKQFALSVYQYNLTQVLPDEVFVVKSLQNKTTNEIKLGHEEYDLWLGGNSVVLQTSNNTIDVDTLVSNLGTMNTNMQTYAKTIELSIDSNYDLVAIIKDANGNIISQDDVDLPLESIITSATYYDTYTYGGTTYTQVIVITLATTSVPTIIPVEDLVSGLVSTTDLANALLDYYTKTQTNTLLDGKANASTTYTKTEVNGLLNDKADAIDNAFEYDSTNTEYDAKGNVNFGSNSIYVDFDYLYDGNTSLQSELTTLGNEINNKQDTLVSGTNIKSINNVSLMGSGNISVQPVLEDSGANQNIKTINNTSLLGNGNIAVQEVLIGSGTGQNLKTIGGNNLLGSGDIEVIKPSYTTPQTIENTGNFAYNLVIKGIQNYSTIKYMDINNHNFGCVGAGQVATNTYAPVYIDVSNITHQLAYQETILTYAKSLEMSIDSNYDLVVTLKDANGNVLSTQDVDLPLESVVVGGSYDSVNEKIVLTLENGNTIDIPVADLVSGLVSQTDLSTNYYNKTSVDNLLSAKADSNDLGTQVTMTFSNGVLTIVPL